MPWSEFLNGVETYSPTPSGSSALAITDNFQTIADLFTEVVRFRGTWSSSTAYVPGDFVIHSGISYICTTANTNAAPPSGDWATVSSAPSTPTLTEVLGTGNNAAGENMLMAGGTISLNDGGGSNGGNLNLDGGQLNLGSGADIKDDGVGGIIINGSNGGPASIQIDSYNNIYLNQNQEGAELSLNDGSGSGGGSLNLDGGAIQIGGSEIGGENGGYIQADDHWGMNFVTGYDGVINWSMNQLSILGNRLCLNDGSGTGGGLFALDGGAIIFDAATNPLSIADTAGGTQIGTASDQLLAFWGQTPTALPTAHGVTTSGFTDAGSTAIHLASTYKGSSGSTAYTIGDIVTALKAVGILTA